MNNARILKNRTASTRTRRSHSLRVRDLRHGGFTLIEILVALVVFVVGALAIVRIFPPALGVIQNSENRTVATNLSKGTLAAYENDPSLIPSAVYDLNANFDGSAVVGSINVNNSLPNSLQESLPATDPNFPGFAESALGHFKIIQGETQRILIDNSPPILALPMSRRYVLTQFSYDWGTGNEAKAYVEDRVDGVRVYTDAVLGSGTLDFSNAKLASDGRAFNDVDYRWADGTDGGRTPGTNRRQAPREWVDTIPAPPIPLKRFYVSYNWFDGSRVQGVVDEPLSSSALQVKAAGISGRAVVDGPISLRVRRRVTTVDATTNDERADALRGYLPLVFADAADLRRTVNGFDQLVYPSVSLTYTVRDWRWLVEDTTLIPSTAAFTDVTVPMRFIDGDNLNINLTSDPNLRGSVFVLTFNAPNNATPPVANVTNTQRWDGSDPTNNNGGDALRRVNNDTNTIPTTPLTDEEVFVNAKKGLVHFAFDPASVQRARVVYWTTDQWARQLSVAAKSYTPWYNVAAALNTSSEPWREYSWAGPGGSTANRGTLYFRPSEVGKTVVVTFEYDADPGAGTDFQTKTAPMTIEDGTADATTLPASLAGFSAVRVAQLKLSDPGAPGSNAVYDVTAIRAVRGASVMVRTAWADGGRYQQEVASTYRPLDEN